MDQTRSHGFLLKLCRILLFGGSLAFSLSWLVSPESVARVWSAVTAYVSVAPSATTGTPTAPPPPLVPVAALQADSLRAALAARSAPGLRLGLDHGAAAPPAAIKQ